MDISVSLAVAGGRDLAVRLEVGGRLNAGRVSFVELGAGGGGVHRDVVGLCAGAQLRQA